ncbi:MAG: VPLPA-CTERM sorting domain-containing protein, partial [Pseudolabrys sp.]
PAFCASCSIVSDHCNELSSTRGTDLEFTPLPAALPLFATGFGALGLLSWRRKRKAQAVA